MILAVEYRWDPVTEVILRPPHNTKTISIQIWGIALEDEAWAGELKAGPKTQKLPVVRAAGPENQNWRYAVSSHNKIQPPGS